MYCKECGEALGETAKFCSKCGTKQPEKETQEPAVADKPSKKNENENDNVSLRFKLGKTCECETSIRAIAMSPNGKYFATGHSKDGGLYIWDTSTFKEVKYLSSDRIMSIAFSPDSNYLVASDSFIEKKFLSENRLYYINVYSIESGDRIIELDCGSNKGFCDSLSFSPDGKRIIGTRGSTPRLWDTEDGQQLLEFPKDAEKIIFHPKESKLISSNYEGISIWDEDSAEEIEKIIADKNDDNTIQFKSIVCSDDGKYLAAGTLCGKIFIWNFKSLECIKRLQVTDSNEGVESICFNPSLSNVVAFSTNSGIKIWDLKKEKEIKKLNLEYAFWTSFTPDGNNLLAVSGKKVIKWNVTKE